VGSGSSHARRRDPAQQRTCTTPTCLRRRSRLHMRSVASSNPTTKRAPFGVRGSCVRARWRVWGARGSTSSNGDAALRPKSKPKSVECKYGLFSFLCKSPSPSCLACYSLFFKKEKKVDVLCCVLLLVLAVVVVGVCVLIWSVAVARMAKERCWRVGFPRRLFPPLWCFPPRCLGAVHPPVLCRA